MEPQGDHNATVFGIQVFFERKTWSPWEWCPRRQDFASFTTESQDSQAPGGPLGNGPRTRVNIPCAAVGSGEALGLLTPSAAEVDKIDSSVTFDPAAGLSLGGWSQTECAQTHWRLVRTRLPCRDPLPPPLSPLLENRGPRSPCSSRRPLSRPALRLRPGDTGTRPPLCPRTCACARDQAPHRMSRPPASSVFPSFPADGHQCGDP